MGWGKISTCSGLDDLRRQGYNNKHVVKAEDQSLILKEKPTVVSCVKVLHFVDVSVHPDPLLTWTVSLFN